MSRNKVWFMALVAALGGFLFGFDTIVINGAEQDIQRLLNLSGTLHGWVVSSALWGTVAGALVGGWISDRFGRKPTLCAIGSVYFLSALWSALATGPVSLMLARLRGWWRSRCIRRLGRRRGGGAVWRSFRRESLAKCGGSLRRWLKNGAENGEKDVVKMVAFCALQNSHARR